MNILFVHQNFPGQFKHLAPHLVRAGHNVKALGMSGSGLPEVPLLRYGLQRGPGTDTHPLAKDFEAKVVRGEACALAAAQLRAQGFHPDIIIANPGWGESLFLRDIWPRARMLALLEFHYSANGLDVGFDPEFGGNTLASDARVRSKNASRLLVLDDMDWGLCPTEFQRSTLPAVYQSRTSVIFDGIDTEQVRPDSAAHMTLGNRELRAGDETITFVNRNLEPYRGYHRFMRALPDILRKRPKAVAVIVGGDSVSYGAAAPAGTSWKQIFLDEVRDQLDLSRVIFTGRLSYTDYLRVLQVSACHVYLTYPFVLGWSCVEALAAGALVVGSDTGPVREVIQHGHNGLLVDFFDAQSLADAVVDVLAQPQQFTALRQTARAQAVERYDLASVCLPQQLALLQQLHG
jgi:glycosyltransferase involved in cell wall biosynthesis